MDLLVVLQSLFWYFGSYHGITEHIHVCRILYMYYRTYTCISDLTCILRNLYWYYGTYTGISDLIRVLQDLVMYFRFYTLQIVYLSYGSYTFEMVPVGTISRN